MYGYRIRLGRFSAVCGYTNFNPEHQTYIGFLGFKINTT